MISFAERTLAAVRSRMTPAIPPVRRVLIEGGHTDEGRSLRLRDGRIWTREGAVMVRLDPPRDKGPVRVDDLDAERGLARTHDLVLHLSAVAETTRIRGPASAGVPYLLFQDGPGTTACANMLRLEAEATFRKEMKALSSWAASIHDQLSRDFKLGERSLVFSRDGTTGEISTVRGRDPFMKGVFIRTDDRNGWVVLTDDRTGSRSSVGLHEVSDIDGFLAEIAAGRIPRTPFGMRFAPDMLPHDADVLGLCETAEGVAAQTRAFETVRPLLDPTVPEEGIFQIVDEAALAWAYGPDLLGR